MSSFSDYYKKWKEDNGITQETSHQNLTSSEKAQRASQIIDKNFERIRAKNLQEKQEEQQKKQNQKQLEQNNRKANFEKFLSNKTTAMNEVSNKIQEENEKKRQQEQQFKDYLVELSKANKKPQGVQPIENNQYQGNRSVSEEILFPTNTKYELVNSEETTNAKLLKSEDMYDLTGGKIDKRNQFQKVKDDVTGIGGNVAMGIESVIPSMTKYINTGGEIATAKAGSQIMQSLFNTNKETAEKLGQQVFSKAWEATEISKANKELNSNKMESWRKETINNNINKTTNSLSKKIAEITPSVGQNIIPMAVSYFNPAAGTALFMSSAAGSYLNDAEERGMNKEQAFTYATVMGTFEGTTEQVISGKMLSNSMKLFNGVGLSKEVLNSFGVSTAENFLQEAIMEPLQETTATVVGGKDKANWDNILNRSLEAGVDGVLSSILLNGASVGIASASNIINKKNPTQAEVQIALEDTINSKKVDVKSIVEGAKEAIRNSKDFLNLDYSDLLQRNAVEEQINPQTQQITNQVDKMDQNGNIEILDNVISSYSGQTNSIIEAKINGEKVGTLEYSEYNGEPSISMINVDEKYRRNGIAKKMLQELQLSYPDIEINWGTMTTEGAKLRDAVTYNVENKEVLNKKNELENIKNTLKEYEQKANDGTLTKEEDNNWNRLYDRKQILEKELYNKKSYKNFVYTNDNLANTEQTVYNNTDLDRVKNVPIEEVLQFKTDGGYRNEQYMAKLRENIKKNGIKYPIELVRNNNGSIEIENGNHRLQIANELGLKEVPIKFVKSWDNIGYVDETESKFIERLEVYNDRNNTNSREVDIFNGGSRTNKEYSTNYRNEFKNGETTTGNDRLSNRVHGYNDRPSSNSTFKQNFKELEKSSSFNSPKNNIQKENNTDISPYRTMEEIANDNTISDIQAFKEATEQLDTPSDKILQQRENELSNQGIEKSPTIDYIKKKRSKEKVSLKEIKDTLAQKFVNKGHYIDKLAKQTGNDNLTYLYDRTMNSFNEAQISIGDYQINSKGEKVGKSIIDIFEPANKLNLSLELDDYLLNKHNVSRYAHEKGIYGNEVSAIDSKKIVDYYENKYPEFKEWSAEVSKYNDNNLKDLVDNGMVSEDMYKKLKGMYGDYVPTYRDITDNISQYIDDSVGGNTLGKATQSDREILSVSESMAEQTLAIKKAIRMNNLGVELYNTIGKKNGETFKGVQFNDVAIQSLGGNVIEKATDGSNKFIIFQDGEMTKFKISDELYTAFAKDTLQNKINNSKVAKAILTPVEKLSKVQRELLTTYSIGFAIRNPYVDFQEGIFNSKYSASFVKNYPKALYNIGTKGSWYQSFKNNGATANTYFDNNKGILPINTKNPFKKFGNAIRTVNEVLEQAPRLAEYISTIEHGGSIDEALYNAAEVTTNFKRGGDVTKAVNKYGANFLNASVQGLDKLYRNLSGQRGWKGYANILTKATVYMVAPAIINSLLLGDDEDYENLPEYTKDNYFLFKTGEGKFFRIPKGRVSSVVGGIARRSLEANQGKQVDWKSLTDTTLNQLAPNNPLSDNIVAPLVQAKKNKAWYGGDIVSNRLQKLPTREQYDESTDELSKFIGDKLNISPKKVNYVLDQYSGGIGDVLLPMATPQAENNILEDKFTTDAVMKNKHVSEYYSKIEELEKNKNSQNATDEDKIKYKYMTEVSKELGDLYNQKRDIQNSNKVDVVKKKEVREVQKKINDIVEERLEKTNTIKTTNLTAKIGDSEYYKYNNEWTRLTDKEKEKNKNISLASYADYKNKVYNLTKEKKKNGEVTEEGQIKNKDKIGVLLNSKGTSKEKEEIYKNYIGTQDKKIQLVDKLNFPLEEYLKYKQQDFENDKDKNGKSISGTGRQKVYDYLNNISTNNLSDNYKKIICKIEGINDYDVDVVIFINNYNSITTNEKREILENIGYEIDEEGYVVTKSILPIRKYIK